jgi:hypothetical protein
MPRRSSWREAPWSPLYASVGKYLRKGASHPQREAVTTLGANVASPQANLLRKRPTIRPA